MNYAFGTPTLLIYGRDEGISDPFQLEGVSHWLDRGFYDNSGMGVGSWNRCESPVGLQTLHTLMTRTSLALYEHISILRKRISFQTLDSIYVIANVTQPVTGFSSFRVSFPRLAI